jgi:biopolymer transport protein ExbD
MTPLIDVTFLLIIFALLISHFVQQEEKLLRLPKADQAQDTRERLPRKLIITVSRSGVISMGGQSHDLQALESVFRGELAKNPNVSVQLRADGDMNYETVQKILRRCAQAGIWKVSFAVNKESEDLKSGNHKHDTVH